MKWQVSAGAFEHRVTAWLNQINAAAETPPLIVNVGHGFFELNCDNPLLEALNRANVQKHLVILWMTELTDYDRFRDEYAAYM
ncbi:hypothetical protein R70723_15595 [Paenibacillus sp. FSL R7-0273]|uniref:hypothetical protein n=1 Tax=Paenibacillus sp. FSL R7-0273 TaxID=1536772 RepID=UPI0004F5AA0D|nr:hypothetical protein [Paenibacillus sp. FSL R7-0273]AIQ47150.1 hypothetical protein R70723_15595 [Paenibacillus sp. FSL R7-0273]OMF97095.1 hypothetical protein BK144_00050 [Paenibacillus sp. FSL R7-0273]